MRHLFAYLLFVGLPFAGLLGVLRLGQAIRAPQAVHGQYAVTRLEAADACGSFLLNGDSTLTLAQSGRQVTAALGPGGTIALRGAISGSELILTGVLSPGVAPRVAACPAGDTLRLTGLARPAPDYGQLDATLRFAHCRDCAPTDFSAKRIPQRRGRHG